MPSSDSRPSRFLLLLILVSFLFAAGARQWRVSQESVVVEHTDRLLNDLDALRSTYAATLDSLRGVHGP